LGNLPKEMVRQEMGWPVAWSTWMNGLHEIGGDMPGESAERIQSRIRTMKEHIAIGVPITRQSCTKSRRVACCCAGYWGFLSEVRIFCFWDHHQSAFKGVLVRTFCALGWSLLLGIRAFFWIC
jgi:hypothetical protein